MRKLVFVFIMAAAGAGAQAPVAKPAAVTSSAGAITDVAVTAWGTAVDWSKYDVTVANPTSNPQSIRTDLQEKGVLTLQMPVRIPDSAKYVRFTVTVAEKATPANKVDIQVDVTAADREDWEARAIVGFHQAGASSASSEQNFFFDFFVVRPIGKGNKVYDNRFNLWGDVRIASAPQQVTVPVSQFVTGFAEAVGNLPVNQLAMGGEFLTGFEIRLPYLKYQTREKVRTLGFVGFFGANGAFSDPVSRAQVFRAVSKTSPQFQNFVANFPQYGGPNALDPNTNGKYVALVPPDRERFFRQYGFGLRYTAYQRKATYAPPEMFTITVGQDQAITRGRYIGPVLKVDGFYPLPLSVKGNEWNFIYLFGTANLGIARPVDRVPLAMQLVSNPCAAGQDPTQGTCGVAPYSDNVAVIAVPSSRDTYRVGAGIDLVALFKRWGVK